MHVIGLLCVSETAMCTSHLIVSICRMCACIYTPYLFLHKNNYIVRAAWYGLCLHASRVRFGVASMRYRASLDKMSAVMCACEFTYIYL
jgi:hypothetical protein